MNFGVYNTNAALGYIEPLTGKLISDKVYAANNATSEQVGGSHYKDMKIQPIEFIHKNNIPFMEGNIIKYICRHRNKNKAEDIKKVIHYCKLILELEYNEKI